MYGVLPDTYANDEKEPYAKDIKHLNEALQKEKLPFEVEIDFITYDETMSKDKLDTTHYYEALDEINEYDIICFPTSYQSLLTLQDIVNKGYIECLDDFFQSEEGKKVYQAYPSTAIDAMSVNGHYYLLPTYYDPYAIVDSSYYIYDQFISNDLNLEKKQVALWEDSEIIVNRYLNSDSNYGLLGLSDIFYQLDGYDVIDGVNLFSSPFVLNNQTNEIQFILATDEFQNKYDHLKRLYDAQNQKLIYKDGFYYINYKSKQRQVTSFLLNGIDIGQPQHEEIQHNNRVICHVGVGISTACKQKDKVYEFLTHLSTNQALNQALKRNGFIYTLGNVFQSEFEPLEGIDEYIDQDTMNAYLENLPMSKSTGFSYDSSAYQKAYQDIMRYYLDFDETLDGVFKHFNYHQELDQYVEKGIEDILKDMNQQYQDFLYK